MKSSKNRRKTNEKISLDKTPPGLLIKKYGYTLVDLGDEVYRLRIESGEKIKEKTPYYSIRRAFLGETNLEQENKKYIIQILKCSPEELELALNRSRIAYLSYRKCLNNLNAREEKELIFLNSGLSTLKAECVEANTQEKVRLVSSPQTILADFNFNNDIYSITEGMESQNLNYSPYDYIFNNRKCEVISQKINNFNNSFTPNYNEKSQRLTRRSVNAGFVEVLGTVLDNIGDSMICLKKYKLWFIGNGSDEFKFLDTVYLGREQEGIQPNSPKCCKRFIVVKLAKKVEGSYSIEFEMPLETPAPIPGTFYTLRSTTFIITEEVESQSLEVSEWAEMDENDYSIEIEYRLLKSDSKQGQKLKQQMHKIGNGDSNWYRIDCQSTSSAPVKKIYL
ncbi:MAG: hypothetical protein AAF757_02410 [Cyanobacteria bacterium P01_D01_bin.116]